MEVITNTIRDMEAPVTTTSDQLPQATAHLNDLANMTEEGTHRVLTLTEAIETNRVSMQKAVEQLGQKLKGDYATEVDELLTLINDDERRIMDIHVALSFQDLVAQRVAKLVTILNEVQHKLLKLVVMFGIKQKKDGGPVQDGGRGYEMLRQLESSKTTALEQGRYLLLSWTYLCYNWDGGGQKADRHGSLVADPDPGGRRCYHDRLGRGDRSGLYGCNGIFEEGHQPDRYRTHHRHDRSGSI